METLPITIVSGCIFLGVYSKAKFWEYGLSHAAMHIHTYRKQSAKTVLSSFGLTKY